MRCQSVEVRHSREKEPGAIGTVAWVWVRPTWVTEGNANARLIAAAPAMYEALRDCVAALERVPEFHGAPTVHPAALRGRAALAQAEGR
jgi:hypothetical protein